MNSELETKIQTLEERNEELEELNTKAIAMNFSLLSDKKYRRKKLKEFKRNQKFFRKKYKNGGMEWEREE